ncbi:MAG: 4-hydroxy-3-methylbut-2-enyl diphosphate reductase [Dehalococcoidia bacterium]|nr:4-hydroxy-3-methylbut-2-enyl diphosphate reductase [Dehalococcoidia bacterium]
MKIEKAAEIGFCTGVKRAINILERAAVERGPIQTLGPIVHNQQVVERLAKFGVKVAESLDQLEGNTVAISSHGVSPQVVEQIKDRGLQIVDTTCPFVRRTQVAARRLAGAGFFVIVFGEESHPEVQGILGHAKGKGLATLELPKFNNPPQRIGILSQTTQCLSGFVHFILSFAQSYLALTSELRVVNTICDATSRRQQAALELAERVDLMLVVGSRSSANTQRLAEICSAVVETHHIERAQEIDPLWLRNHRPQYIGVTAGASTPEEAIEEAMALLLEDAVR